MKNYTTTLKMSKNLIILAETKGCSSALGFHLCVCVPMYVCLEGKHIARPRHSLMRHVQKLSESLSIIWSWAAKHDLLFFFCLIIWVDLSSSPMRAFLKWQQAKLKLLVFQWKQRITETNWNQKNDRTTFACFFPVFPFIIWPVQSPLQPLFDSEKCFPPKALLLITTRFGLAQSSAPEFLQLNRRKYWCLIIQQGSLVLRHHL